MKRYSFMFCLAVVQSSITCTSKEEIPRKSIRQKRTVIRKCRTNGKALQTNEKTYPMYFVFEIQTHDLEFAQVQAKVVSSLRQGTDALKKMNELMKLEDIETLMEDSREAIEYQKVRFELEGFGLSKFLVQEVSNLLAGGLSDADEEDVEAELEDLIRNDDLHNLPDVPQHQPTSSKFVFEFVLLIRICFSS